MYRVFSVSVTMVLGALLAPELAAQSGDGVQYARLQKGKVGPGSRPEAPAPSGRTIQLGKVFKGELKGKKVGTKGQGYPNAKLPVMLKAGQTLDISVTVVGKDRRVGLRVLDPNGAVIGDPHLSRGGPNFWPVKSCQYAQEEVPSSGKYTIEVWSDLAGPFTLRASARGEDSEARGSDNSEAKRLEKRVEQLRRELEEAERNLRKAKGSPGLKNGIEKK